MPFTQENKPLLEEAASIDFQFMKNGIINSGKHSSYELGLYFIKRAVELHGNRYYYGKVAYVTNSTKVILQCKEHGEYTQEPRSHLSGQGCPACVGVARITTEEFVKRANLAHGGIYNYSKSYYTWSNSMLDVICQHHGTYTVRADHHLSGVGCAKCYYDSLKKSTHEFIEKAINIHGHKYNYEYVDYKSAHGKVTIICEKHGPFEQEANSHLQGRGCPKCAGQDHNILYLLKCLDTGWYKIGITTNNTKNRISHIGGNIEEIHHVILDDPRKHETILHKRYEKDREYNPCVRNGNTEFFSLNEQQVQEVIAYMNEVSDEG